MIQRKGRADGSDAGGSGGSGGGYGGGYGDGGYGDGSFDKEAPKSRATTDGDAPLFAKD